MILDWSRLNGLKQGDEEEDRLWLEDMIRSLRKNMNVRLDNIKSYAAQRKSEELRAELHQTKGVAANFGLAALQAKVTEAEAKLKQGDLATCLTLCEDLPDIWEKTKTELKTKFPE